jgi:hypothetical protein
MFIPPKTLKNNSNGNQNKPKSNKLSRSLNGSITFTERYHSNKTQATAYHEDPQPPPRDSNGLLHGSDLTEAVIFLGF